MGPVFSVSDDGFARLCREGVFPILPDLAPGTRVLFWNRHRLLGPFRRAARGWESPPSPLEPAHCYRGSPGPVTPREWPRLWQAMAEARRSWPRYALTAGRFGGMDLVTWLPWGDPAGLRHRVLPSGPFDGPQALWGSLQGQALPMARRDAARQAGRHMVSALLGDIHPAEGGRITYHLPHDLLPQGFYQGGFWGARHRLVRHRVPLTLKWKGLLPRRGVLLALGRDGDPGMADEAARLRAFFHTTTLAVEHMTGAFTLGAFCRALEACRIFHYIGHGPQGQVGGGLRLGRDTFDLGHLLSLARTPEVVFLSCCGDVEKSFVDAWFARGTKALVCPRGVLRSESMGDFSLSFYGHWRHHRRGLDSALLHARRRWGRRDWNGLLLELTGEARVPFEPDRRKPEIGGKIYDARDLPGFRDDGR